MTQDQNGAAAVAAAGPHALRDALRAASAGAGGLGSAGGDNSDSSFVGTSSESASEEDYDELTAPPAEAMVLRQRRRGAQRTASCPTQQTHLRNEVPADEIDEKKTKATTTARKQDKNNKLSPSSYAESVPEKLVLHSDLLDVPTSRQQKGGRKLSATVIFEEKSGSGSGTTTDTSGRTSSLSSSATAVSSAGSAEADEIAGGSGISTLQEFFPSEKEGGKKGESDEDDQKQRRSFIISIDDPKLAEILRADLEQLREDIEERRAALTEKAGEKRAEAAAGVSGSGSHAHHHTVEGKRKKPRGRFRDFVFTRGFSTFDRQNAAAANSPFHGFFTLFWLSVFVFMVRIGATNWRKTGSPLGTNEIMANMFHRDVVVLLASDGVLCALTGVSWLLQRAVLAGWIDWDGAGWVLQNVWQTSYLAGLIGWTHLRDWPWSHTVFFVLHGLVMLMKQHSFAFYNGYLSTLYKRRTVLQARLAQLELSAAGSDEAAAEGNSEDNSAVETAANAVASAAADADQAMKQSANSNAGALTNPEVLDKVVAALQSGQPLDGSQMRVFARILQWEIDGLTEELRGKATRPEKAYPHNLTFANHYEYIVLPTVVYELEYPRSETINWRYAAEKLVAVFGIIFVMIMISQAFIYPVVMQTVAMKEAGIPLRERFMAFPWMLSDLIFPFMMEYLLTWYLIWETILNFLAEITYFADRSFYAAWWNSVTWDEFARDWNRPVHLFLLRHVYHSSISAMKVNRHTATLITFFLSACVHELIMWCIFKKLRGYLLFLQMCQLPLVRLSRTKWLRNRQTLGNVMFWTGIFMGPSVLCSLYLIL